MESFDESDSDSSDSFGSETGLISDFFNPFRSSARLQASLKDEDFNRVKKQLNVDLRIGSCLHIGQHNSKEPYSLMPLENKSKFEGSSTIANCDCMFYSPFHLICAREQGECGQRSKSYRLRNYFCRSQPIPHPGHRIRWPPNQNFKEHFQGNLWCVTSLGLETTHKCHSGCVNALNFSPCGRLIASGSDDQRVAVTNVFDGKLVTNFHSGHNLNVFQVKFVPETAGTQIVTAGRDSMVRLSTLHETGNRSTTRLLAKHNGPCHKLAFVADSPDTFLSAGEDGCVFSIDLRDSKATSVFDRRRMSSDAESAVTGFLHSFVPPHLIPEQAASRHRFVSSHHRIIVDDYDGADTVASVDDDVNEEDEDMTEPNESLSLQLGRRIRSLLGARSASESGRTRSSRRVRVSSRLDPLHDHVPTKFNITAAVYSAQGDAILASFNDEDLYLFDSINPGLPPIHSYRGHRNMDTVKGVNFFGPNSEYIVSGSDDGFVYIWDRHSEGIVQWLCADVNGSVNVLESHPFLPVLATSGIDYDFKIWSPQPSMIKNYVTPDAWLPSLRSKESDNSLLFDPELVIKSMNQLRKSPLASRLFGDSFKFPVAKRIARSDGDPIVSAVDVTVHMDTETPIQSADPTPLGSRRKRVPCSSDEEESNGVVDGCQKRPRSSNLPSLGKETTVTPAAGTLLKGSIIGGPIAVVQAPQSVLPFNARDLQLRVAINWIERCRESQSFSFLGNSEMRLLSTLASITSARLQFSDGQHGEDESDGHRDVYLSWDDDGDRLDVDQVRPGERVCLVIRRPPNVTNLLSSPDQTSSAESDHPLGAEVSSPSVSSTSSSTSSTLSTLSSTSTDSDDVNDTSSSPPSQDPTNDMDFVD